VRKFFSGFLLGTLLLPLIGLYITFSGRWPVSAIDDPPTWERMIAQQSLAKSVPLQAPKLRNPITPSSENLRLGIKIYRQNCSGCHGDTDKTSHWGTSAFYPRVPQFATEPSSKPDWQLFWIVKNGIRYSGMGAWNGELPEEKIWTVVTFLANLRALPPDVEKEWLPHENRLSKE